MSMYEEFKKLDHKNKSEVIKFLDKYKDDPRDTRDFGTINDYYELYSILDDVLIEAGIDQYDYCENYDDSVDEEYWNEHPTYLRAKEIGEMVETCAKLEEWDLVLFEDVRGISEDIDIYAIWRYIERLVRKYTNKGMECICDGESFLADTAYDEDDLDVSDDDELMPGGMPMDILSLNKDDKDFEKKLIWLRSNLLDIIKYTGNFTIAFHQDDELYKQLVLASENGKLYVAKDGGSNLIVPSIDGMIPEQPETVYFSYWG